MRSCIGLSRLGVSHRIAYRSRHCQLTLSMPLAVRADAATSGQFAWRLSPIQWLLNDAANLASIEFK